MTKRNESTDTPISFGKYLKAHRKARDLTQEKLAELVGYSLESIRKIESDQQRPSKYLAERLADKLALSPDEASVFIRLARTLPTGPTLSTPQPVSVSHNLPLQLTSFIGRKKEIAEIKRLLSEVRLVTLTGSGGTGKTRLSLQVAAELLESFSGGVWLVELAPLSDPSLVPQTVATALGVREEAGRTLLATLTDYLRAKDLLIVLDNCEHLIDACAQLVNALLQACSRVRILTSSREALDIGNEKTFQVPSLSLPDSHHLPSLEALAECEAVRLFVDRAMTALSSFSLTPQNALAVAQICRQLDGVPLAIELAAARVKILTVEQIATRLDDRFRLLTGGSRTAPRRQQTLQATMDWSYDLLSEPERMLLGRLAVFAGGWTLEAAEAVCISEPLLELGHPFEGETNWGDASDVLNLLAQLVNKSLVVVEYTQSTEARYHLLETIRRYAWKKLSETEEADGVEKIRNRHLDYFLRLAERAEPELRGAGQIEWLNRLEVEHDNIRVALEGSLHDQKIEQGLALAGTLWWFWHIRNYRHEGADWLERMLSIEAIEWSKAARPRSTTRVAARAKALCAGGWLMYITQKASPAQARVLLMESLTLSRESNLESSIAVSLLYLSVFARYGYDYNRAVAWGEEALQLFRELGDTFGVAQVLSDVLGPIALTQGNYEQAWALQEKGLALRRELKDKDGIAWALLQLGDVSLYKSDFLQAQKLYEEALLFSQEVGNKQSAQLSLYCLGIAALCQMDYERARVLFKENLVLWQDMGNVLGMGWALARLGDVDFHEGNYDRAMEFYQECLKVAREKQEKTLLPYALGRCGSVLFRQGKQVQAVGLFRESLINFQEGGDRYDEDDRRNGVVECLGWLAELILAQESESPERRNIKAVKLLGAAEVLYETGSKPVLFSLPTFRSKHDLLLATLRTQVEEAAFAAAWVEGRAMTLEQSVAYALAELGADG